MVLPGPFQAAGKSHPIPSGPCSRPTPGEVRSPGTTPEPGLRAWRALAVRSPLPWRRPGACSETAIVGLPGVASAQQWLDWGLAASLAVAVGSSAFPRSSLLAAGQTEARDMWGCQGAGTAQNTKTQDTKKRGSREEASENVQVMLARLD